MFNSAYLVGKVIKIAIEGDPGCKMSEIQKYATVASAATGTDKIEVSLLWRGSNLDKTNCFRINRGLTLIVQDMKAEMIADGWVRATPEMLSIFDRLNRDNGWWEKETLSRYVDFKGV